MKERILQSLQGKAEILEQIDNEIFAVHYFFNGQHGYAAIKGEQVIGKEYLKNNKPLSEWIADRREAYKGTKYEF